MQQILEILLINQIELGACNNSIRALEQDGMVQIICNVIHYQVTIATTGNGVDFGDLLTARSLHVLVTSDTWWISE